MQYLTISKNSVDMISYSINHIVTEILREASNCKYGEKLPLTSEMILAAKYLALDNINKLKDSCKEISTTLVNIKDSDIFEDYYNERCEKEQYIQKYTEALIILNFINDIVEQCEKDDKVMYIIE